MVWFRGLKPFRIWLCIRRENLQKCPSQIAWCPWHRGIWSRGVNDTTGSDPAESMIPQEQIQRCQWYRGIPWHHTIRLGHFCKLFHSVNATEEADSAMSLTPRPIPRCQWLPGIRSRVVNDTAGSDPPVSIDTAGSDPIIHENDYWLPSLKRDTKAKRKT
jgi:hypothetical protein